MCVRLCVCVFVFTQVQTVDFCRLVLVGHIVETECDWGVTGEGGEGFGLLGGAWVLGAVAWACGLCGSLGGV